ECNRVQLKEGSVSLTL
ncbi:tetracycline resistance efflux system leader peptide, partial [Enterococcus hirae]|nr:tetracycline resistance efflux system leader peptide [Listeria monocytogenes]EAE5953775.1 tetracycline resistance efflux system leader peptide [Listeria monocytogenes]EGP5622512.1 tetracycline resistance efflux system leader peptide [Enterococcus faecium]EME7104560.1 tetracycline resistance efflux system leader peptide [Enterococcus faecium]